MPLGDFVKGSLDRELFWAETRPGTRAVELQMASIACYKCRKTIKAVRGYVINNHFVPLAEVSDTGALAAFVSALRQHLPEVTRFPNVLAARFRQIFRRVLPLLLGTARELVYDGGFLHRNGKLRLSRLLLPPRYSLRIGDRLPCFRLSKDCAQARIVRTPRPANGRMVVAAHHARCQPTARSNTLISALNKKWRDCVSRSSGRQKSKSIRDVTLNSAVWNFLNPCPRQCSSLYP